MYISCLMCDLRPYESGIPNKDVSLLTAMV